jgi:hypothetical protein
MRGFPIALFLFLFVALFPRCARAQLPTASGRTIVLATDPQQRHKLFIPDHFVNAGQPVDVLVHFHGDFATVNNNAKYANLNAVVINVTYGGLSSAYQTPFSHQSLFGNILADALTKLRAQPDFADDVSFGNLAISSFSAGYAAVREILKSQSYFDQIDGIHLADSLYASFTSATDHRPLASQMVDYRRFALAAAQANDKVLIFSHSQVPTFTYCRTDECADDLAEHAGAAWQTYHASGLGGMQIYRRSVLGNFSVYGASGTDAPAHAMHLQWMGQFLGALPLAHVPDPRSVYVILPLSVTALMRRRQHAAGRRLRGHSNTRMRRRR